MASTDSRVVSCIRATTSSKTFDFARHDTSSIERITREAFSQPFQLSQLICISFVIDPGKELSARACDAGDMLLTVTSTLGRLGYVEEDNKDSCAHQRGGCYKMQHGAVDIFPRLVEEVEPAVEPNSLNPSDLMPRDTLGMKPCSQKSKPKSDSAVLSTFGVRLDRNGSNELAPASNAVEAGLENAPSHDDAPMHPGTFAAAYEEMEKQIKDSLLETQSDDDAPLPPVEIAAFYEGLEGMEIVKQKELATSDASPKEDKHSSIQGPQPRSITTRLSPALSEPHESGSSTGVPSRDQHQGTVAIALTSTDSLQPASATSTDDTSRPSIPMFHEVEARRVDEPDDVPIYEATIMNAEDESSRSTASQHWPLWRQKRKCLILWSTLGIASAAVAIGVTLSPQSPSIASGSSFRGGSCPEMEPPSLPLGQSASFHAFNSTEPAQTLTGNYEYLVYGEEIFLQSAAIGYRWLKHYDDGSIFTINYYDVAGYTDIPSYYQWRVRSDAILIGPEIDPMQGQCIKYGDIIFLSANGAWLQQGGSPISSKGCYEGSCMCRNGGCSVSTKASESSETGHLQWIVRSTVGTGSLERNNNPDPAYGHCIQLLSKIYLQSNNEAKWWLSGARSSGNSAVCSLNFYSAEGPTKVYEQTQTQAYEWMFRKDLGDGLIPTPSRPPLPSPPPSLSPSSHPSQSTALPPTSSPRSTLKYGQKIFLQSESTDYRWLMRSGSGVFTQDAYVENSQHDTNSIERYRWLVRSHPGDPSASDPKNNECIKYGDIIYLNVNGDWLYRGQWPNSPIAGCDCGGGYYQNTEMCSGGGCCVGTAGNQFESAHIQWRIRSTIGNGPPDDIDPAQDQCIYFQSKIYLQSNSEQNWWLNGGRGGAKHRVWALNFYILYEQTIQDVYEWIVREELGDGLRGDF